MQLRLAERRKVEWTLCVNLGLETPDSGRVPWAKHSTQPGCACCSYTEEVCPLSYKHCFDVSLVQEPALATIAHDLTLYSLV